MEEKIKLKLEYKKLIRNGKKAEAQKILKKIWASSEKSIKPKKKEVIIEAKEIKKVSNIISLSDLSNINGIGKKTVKDIKLMFANIDSLKVALRDDKVALRDDVVSLLKSILI